MQFAGEPVQSAECTTCHIRQTEMGGEFNFQEMSALLRSISRTMSCSVKQLMTQKKINKLHETETLLNDGLLCLLWMQFTPDFTVAFRELS